MVQDSAGFQSQQFGEQVAQRRDRYAAQNADSVGMFSKLVPMFQQARAASDERAWGNQDRQFRERQALVQQQQFEQDRQLRAASVASDLATDQLHRQQAQDDLQWAQQLHQTDMIGLQKRGMAADIALKEAQTRKAIEALGKDNMDRFWVPDAYQRDRMIRDNALMGDFSGGRLDVRRATDEERAAADKRIIAEEARQMEMIRERRPRSESAESSRTVSDAGKRLQQITEEIDAKERKMRSPRTEPDEKSMLQQELIGLRQIAKQLGDMMDRELLGERPDTGHPKTAEQTVEEMFSRSSAEALRILDESKPK